MPANEGARRLATVFFTDIVGSTEITTQLGDTAWKALVRRHHDIVRRHLKRSGGREIDTAGDGFFAMFDAPGTAIRCAAAISEDVREVGLEVRCGLHTGEVEIDAEKPRGIAVIIASRVMAEGGAGDVLVTSGLRDAVAGSRLTFTDRGLHALKGVDGDWHLFALESVDGEMLPLPLGAEEAHALQAMSAADGGARGRRRGVVAGALIVAAAVVLAIVLLTGAKDDRRANGTAPAPRGPTGVVGMDPSTGKIDPHAVATDAFAGWHMVAAEGALWETGFDGLTERDATTGERIRTIQFPVEAHVVAAGFHAIWVTAGVNAHTHDLFEVDPNTPDDHPRLVLHDPDPGANGIVFVATDERWVWVLDSAGMLWKIAPIADKVVWQHDVANYGSYLTTGGGSVWVADDVMGELLKIDPSDGHRAGSIALNSDEDQLAYVDGVVWVEDVTHGILTPVDGASMTVAADPVPTPPHPAIEIAGPSVLWIAARDEVDRIDVATESRKVFPISFSASSVALADGTLWVLRQPDGWTPPGYP
jgi:class 3 adenylate cyclase